MKKHIVIALLAIFCSCNQNTNTEPDNQNSDNNHKPKNLGTATVTASNYDCPSGDPRKCYELSISCEGIHEEVTVTLFVAEPLTSYKGTITFHSGAGGKGFWAPDDKPTAKQVLEDVNNSGFRTVEVKWGNNGWLAGSEQNREGITKLGCRPATVLKWIHDNLYEQNNGTEAFCATGNSGGSVQISLSMLNYGMDKYLDLIVPTAGPGVGRIDLGCMEGGDHPLFLDKQTSLFDKSYGFLDSPGPCTTKDESYLARLIDDSQALGERDYVYPQTMIYNLVGAMDTETKTNAQSLEVYNRWLDEGTPFLYREVIAEAGHGVHDSAAGAAKISEALRFECRKH